MKPPRPRESALGREPFSPSQRALTGARHALENAAYRLLFPGRLIHKKYLAFESLRNSDLRALEIISRLEEIRQRNLACDLEHIKDLCARLNDEVRELTASLHAFHPLRYALLDNYRRKYAFYVSLALLEDEPRSDPPYVCSLGELQAEDMVGGKGAALSALRCRFQLPVPPGLAVTTRAFHHFLDSNGLREWIDRQLARLGPNADQEYTLVSQEIQACIMEANIPPEIIQAVDKALEAEGQNSGPLALRSSAVAEDAQVSFAGQYESLLHISPHAWPKAYTSVLASKYSAHALYYRVHKGYTDRQTPMAVVIMPMVQAAVSGIMYTRRENHAQGMDTYMVRGSGQNLAAGSNYQAHIALCSSGDHFEHEHSGQDLLDRANLDRLYQAGKTLDQAFDAAQDIEWVLDDQNELCILQSRPVHFPAFRDPGIPRRYEAPILGYGQWVSSGQACGPFHSLHSTDSPFQLPSGCVLGIHNMPPELTPALDRVAAVVAKQGSPACHLASVAREANVPVICRATGLNDIAPGQVISVDADQGLILDGELFSPAPDETDDTSRQLDSRTTMLQSRLDKALSSIAPLSLRDPEAQNFTIQGCQSLHDIVRFAHESGVREMFTLVGRRGLNRFGAKRLQSNLPLVMHILDVGQGVVPASRRAKVVGLEHIQSEPMLSLWQGLSSPGVQWNPDILHYDWDAYFKSTSNFVDVEKSTQFSSYAIVAQDYVHAMLRFGYHFAVVDALVGELGEHNYLHFSFKGGGGNDQQRQYRLQIIAPILEQFDFSVDVRVDMLEARFDRRDLESTSRNLQVLGFVLGKTVLLDMRLDSKEKAGGTASAILDAINDFLPVQAPRQ
mgnify:CR=1 FL=1